MPNYCDNHVVFTGPHESLTKLQDAFNNNTLLSTFIPANSLDESVSNWGTKWDIGQEDNGSSILTDPSLTLTFHSAWSPPIEYYKAIQPILNVQVQAAYYEPGMTFHGHYTTDLGEQTVCYKKESDIPKDIIDLFGIEEWGDIDIDPSISS